MNRLYPLKFKPIPNERVWGGEKLKNALFQDIENTLPVGESLDISGFEGESTTVSEGFLSGNPLDDILETYIGDLVGEDKFNEFGNLFPITIKRLDVKDYLSVQVHPDDITAMERHYSYGKPELWYILDTYPGAELFIGLKKECTASEIYERCLNGTITEVMNRIVPEKGDFYMIREGCLHTAHGVEIYEISKASDITYRLYDWEFEKKAAGKEYIRREMHLEESLDIIDYGKYDISRYSVSGDRLPADGLVTDNRHFSVHMLTLKDRLHVYTEKFSSFIIYGCVSGKAAIEYSGIRYTLSEGESILIPASLEDFYIYAETPDAKVIECYVPAIKEHDDYIEDDGQDTQDTVPDDGPQSMENVYQETQEPKSPLNFFS